MIKNALGEREREEEKERVKAQKNRISLTRLSLLLLYSNQFGSEDDPYSNLLSKQIFQGFIFYEFCKMHVFRHTEDQQISLWQKI